MPQTAEEVASRYPLHWLVWNDKHEELKAALQSNKYTPQDIELKDPRGRTPLLLAVTLGNLEAARVLIEADADVNCEKDGWTVVQEATATGNLELLSLVLSRRDRQRHAVRCSGIPELLNRLSLAPDFYVEMKWEFTSWVPLVSRMCPFDTYRVYKRGANVRVDTTLVGFENNRWQRGDRTYIFRGHGRSASLVELDHEARTAWSERLGADDAAAAPPAPPPPRALRQRLAAPLAINYLDTDKISFERNKSGIWGWRADKSEEVCGWECKVWGASNVELVSRTRSEHVPAGRVRRRAPLAGLLALADDTETVEPEQEEPARSRSCEDLRPVTWQEYFSDEPLERDVGRPRVVSTKVQRFRATLWLCEDYPLQLQEQIMPILDLMAAMSSPHFAKLKDFVQMQLPAGFPVKIEIPLFHVLNARITFGNIFASETPVPNVQSVREGERLACIVDDIVFSARGYRDAAAPDHLCDDDGLLQFAIQQSLLEAGTHDDQVDVWEALRGARPASPASSPPRPHSRDLLAHEQRELQRAIEESLAAAAGREPADGVDKWAEQEAEPVWAEPVPGEWAGQGPEPWAEEEALRAALEASALEESERERRRRDEQTQLDEALRLSLLDK
ncbi:ankyrin repeat domain-containing protein 13D [Aricia agestis]|uniref:ankyrin repeat domain-containing protein 13D n=1 Tax=Aricia agestis TaxID=91739 RepID=UPI001C203744|nr:ankyrin repeat domain-containing protein 13D [Aricia agestis]